MRKKIRLLYKISYLILSLFLLVLGLFGINRLKLRPALPLSWQTTDKGIEIIQIDPNCEKLNNNISTGDFIVAIDDKLINHSREIEFLLDTKRTGENLKLSLEKDSEGYSVLLTLNSKWDMRFIIMNLLTGVLFWIVGVIIYFLNPNEKFVRIFSLGCIVTAAAILMVWRGYPYNNGAFQYYLHSLLYFIIYPAIPVIILYFSFIYPTEKGFLVRNKLSKYILLLPYITIVLLLEISYLSAIKLETSDSIKIFFISFVIFRAYIISYVILSIFGLIRSYKYAINREAKNKIQWVLWSISLGMAPYLLLWTLPLALINRPLIPDEINYLFLMIIPLAISFSIFKHQLFDIEIIINRSIVYFLITGIIISFYLLLTGITGYFIGNMNTNNNYIFFIICTLIAAIVFSPIKLRIQNLVDKTFYRLKYNYRQAVKDFSNVVFSTLDKNELLDLLMEKINDVIPVERIALILKNPALKDYDLSCFYGLNDNESSGLRFKSNSELIEYIEENKAPMIRKGRANFSPHIDLPDISFLNELEIEMLIPIEFQHQLSGFLLIGQKLSKIKFSEEDTSLLSNMIEGCFIALERLRLQEIMFLERIEKEKLVELNELKSEFISHVSHELRTPITAIFWSVENMLDGIIKKPDPKIIEYLEGIRDNSKHLGRMIENLLDISKIESGKIEIFPESLNVLPEIEKSCNIMKSFCEEKEIVIDLFCPDEIQIKADPDYLMTILTNLIGNAVKYSPNGSTVKINVEQVKLKNNQKVSISVIDNGPGIEKSKQKIIFKRFERIRTESKRSEKGLGLGLYIVKKLVELQNGEIKLKSKINEGSTFTVIFPAT